MHLLFSWPLQTYLVPKSEDETNKYAAVEFPVDFCWIVIRLVDYGVQQFTLVGFPQALEIVDNSTTNQSNGLAEF